MYSLSCYYRLIHKPLIEEAIKYLPSVVFDCWHITPSFTAEIHSGCGEDEFALIMQYGADDAIAGHDAFDKAQDFIHGYLLGKGISLKELDWSDFE